jgi:hypothetical protein
MVAKSLRLTVLTPAETLLDAEKVAWVQAHLADGGGFGIWPGHAPLIAETVNAPLRYADDAGEHALDLEAGFLRVDREGVMLLTSGLARTPAALETPEDSDGTGFDRLAGALLAAMEPRRGEVSSTGDEERREAN